MISIIENLVALVEATISESDFAELSRIPKKIGRLPSVKTMLIERYEECLSYRISPEEVFIYVASQEKSLCKHGAGELQWRLRTLRIFLLSDKLSYIVICEKLRTTVPMITKDMKRFIPYLDKLIEQTKGRMLNVETGTA